MVRTVRYTIFIALFNLKEDFVPSRMHSQAFVHVKIGGLK